VAGVALVVQGGAGVHGAGYLGDVLAIGAALTWAAYSVMLRPLFARYSASRISALMIVLGGMMLLPFGLPQMVTQDWGSLQPLHVSAFAYSAIFPLVVTNVLYFRSLRRIGASRATLYMYLQPFLGVMFAALLIGERVTLVQVLGGVVSVSLGKLFPGATVRE
jgi:drug/metabolite transporter (DMT)-like permease